MKESAALPGNVGAALDWGRVELQPSRTAFLDAQLLMGHVLGRPRSWVLAHGDETLPQIHEAAYRRLVDRRRNGEPIGYIRGFVEWFGMELEVTPDVLIPRPETELLVERAVQLVTVNGLTRIADVGTGSGALAIALARTLPESRVWATDQSDAALHVARRNAIKHRVEDRVMLLPGDLLQPVPDEPELVIANLPYLSDTMMAELDQDVSYEPLAALHGGASGLELYERLFYQLAGRSWSPHVLFEIDPRQAKDALGMVCRSVTGAHASVYSDYAGLERMIEVVQPRALALNDAENCHE